MPKVIAALSHGLLLLKDSVHGTDRAQVHPFIQQRRIDLMRRAVTEALAREHLHHPRPLLRRQRPRMRLPLTRRRGRWGRASRGGLRLLLAIEGRPRHPDGPTRCADTHALLLLDGLTDPLFSRSSSHAITGSAMS